LLSGGGDGADFVYSPFRASWAAGAMYAAAIAVCGVLTTEALWPPLPPQSMTHVLFWCLAAMAPVMTGRSAGRMR
jgi:hypothetical protein